MQINSNEIMLINKRNSYNKLANKPAPEGEQPVSKPEYKVNALEAQANNNIAFHGATIGKLGAKARKFVLPLMMGAAVAATGLGTTSCEPGTTIIVEQNVNVKIEMEQVNQMIDLLKENNKQNEALLAEIAALEERLANMDAKQDAYYATACEFFMTNTVAMNTLIEELRNQGKTEEEILLVLNDINVLMEAQDFESAFAIIQGLLTNIDGKLDTLINEFKAYREDFNKAVEMDRIHDQKQIDLLEKIWNNGDVQIEYLQELVEGQKISQENAAKIIDIINAWGEKLGENQKEFMDYLVNLKPGDVDYSKFETMFKELGLNLADVIDMAKKDALGAANSIENAIKNFQDKYENTAEVQTALFISILDKMNDLENLQKGSPEYTQMLQEIKSAIENLKLVCECKCDGNNNNDNEGEWNEGDLEDTFG